MSQEEPVPSSLSSPGSDVLVDAAPVDKLHKNALRLPGVLYFALGAAAPIAALFFNVPSMAAGAGAAVPLVFLISAIGIGMMIPTIVYFSRRLSSAGGFYTWISHSLGARSAFLAGWLMMGGYAIFEAASQAAFGGLTDTVLGTFAGIHVPGGWLTYSLISTILVSVLTYFDVKWGVWILAPFMVLELGSLLIYDVAITIQGGVAGHDLFHTFTTAGTQLKGVAPGGLLGVGVAMALGVWSWVGFESGAVYGEEAQKPRRTVPLALTIVIITLAVLYTWTSYSVLIGIGWEHAGDVLADIANAPGPYLDTATRFVGPWLQVCMLIAVCVGTFSANISFHNGMTRYLYSMGREQILPQPFGRTHARWKSPYIASVVQSAFTLLVLIFLGLIIQQQNSDGSISYGLGFAGGNYQQTNGISSYAWLAIIGTICFIVVYILTNVAAPIYARRRGEFSIFTHILAPIISTLALLIPLVSFVLPPIPGIGDVVTGLGFAPTPFPLNILPLFVIVWLLIGVGISIYLARTNPERYRTLGHIVSGVDTEEVAEVPAQTADSVVEETPVVEEEMSVVAEETSAVAEEAPVLAETPASSPSSVATEEPSEAESSPS